MQTYDIINAGPRNRFMAFGRIVSNSGRLVQAQNLPQNHLPDLALARELVKAGDEELLNMLFGSAPYVLSELIRTAFIPKDGCRFIVADFSAIEARVLAWLAGEEWVLEEFRGKGKIYEATASRMFHVPQDTIIKGHPNYEYRQKGKQAVLSCIAEGQLVLTDCGLVPIEKVTTAQRVWDGNTWVQHEGVVYRGEKEVFSYDGLTATPEHLVWIEGQSQPVHFGVAAASGAHLAVTEHRGQAIRLGKNYQPGKEMEREMERLLCADGMYILSQYPMDTALQSHKRQIKRLPKLLRKAKTDPHVVGSTFDGSQTSMRESKRSAVSSLWRTRNPVQISISDSSRYMDFSQCSQCPQRERNGSHRQQRELRAGKYPLCVTFCQYKQSQTNRPIRMGSRILALLSKCRNTHAFSRENTGRNYRIRTSSCTREAKRLESDIRTARLYDIRNAGPHHRFTVSGHLVHNCGYGGGVGALKNMGAKMPEDEMQPLVDAWRAANPHIVALWSALDRAARKVIEKHSSARVGRLSLFWQDDRMFIQLPAGRRLCYTSPRFVSNRFGNSGIGYLAPSANGQLVIQETFGGKLAENCLAFGTLVITDHGLIPIERVQASHLIWDGEAFVQHGGLLSKGIRQTIKVDGLWMTPDHQIYTEGGWIRCGKSDGLSWKAAALPDGFITSRISHKRRAALTGALRLWQRIRGRCKRYYSQAIPEQILWLHAWQARQRLTENTWYESPSSICRIVVRKARSSQPVYDIRNCGPRHRFAVWDKGKARIVSNCTQSIARDLLAHGMQQLEAEGYPIVFHVHDEAVMEVPIGQGSVEEACEIMARSPEWAEGLPLRADGDEMAFYQKT